MGGNNGDQPTASRPPGQPLLRLTLSDTLEGPISVIGRDKSPARARPPERRTWFILGAAWTLLSLAVAVTLDSDAQFSFADWLALAVVALAGWPMYVLLRYLIREAKCPGPPTPTTIVLRRGTWVDDPFVRLFADLAGLEYIEPDNLDDHGVT